jgi:hypothetical protein
MLWLHGSLPKIVVFLVAMLCGFYRNIWKEQAVSGAGVKNLPWRWMWHRFESQKKGICTVLPWRLRKHVRSQHWYIPDKSARSRFCVMWGERESRNKLQGPGGPEGGPRGPERVLECVAYVCVFLGSITICSLYTLTLSNQSLNHTANKSQSFRFGLNIFSWYDNAGGTSVKKCSPNTFSTAVHPRKSLLFVPWKWAQYISRTVCLLSTKLCCVILDHLFTSHIPIFTVSETKISQWASCLCSFFSNCINP